MALTRKVKEILSWYESDNPGTKGNLARMLMQGRLGGTGKMVILPAGADHTASMLRVPIDVQHHSQREEIVKNRRFAKTISAERSAWPLTP